jgi:hypothetical protein
MLAPSLTNWKAQYERLERAYARLQDPYSSSVLYNDDLQHFFQDCWHLKDWIKNDKTIELGSSIEKLVMTEKSLRIVADLANGSKHLARHTHHEGAYITATHLTVHLAQNKGIDVNYVITLADATTLSAQDLIHEAFNAWQVILKNLNLHA